MRTLFTIVLMLAASATAWPQGPAVEERSTAPATLPPSGTEIFRGLLDLHGIKPIADKPMTSNIPASGEMLVVIVGGPGRLPEGGILRTQLLHYHSLIAVRAQAGREPYELSNLLQQSPVLINGKSARYFGTQTSATPDSLSENQRSNCPYLRPPFDIGRIIQPNNRDANPFLRFPKVATYRPATIQYPSTYDRGELFPLKPLAILPNGCRDAGPNGRTIQPSEAVALGCEVTIGPAAGLNPRAPQLTRSTLVLSDPNILSNQLLALDGTDNLAFCQQYIKSLKESGVQYCAFYEDGKSIDKFDDVKFQLSPITPPIPIPPPQIIDQLGTQIANQLIDQVDRNDLLNSFWRDRPLWFGRLLSGVMGILVAFFAWKMIRGVWSRRQRPDLRAMPQHPFGKIKMAAGLVGQLQRDVITGGDYGPVVRDYLRDLFLACGLDPNDQSPKPPPIRYEGKSENAPALAKDIFEVWSKVYVSDQPVTLNEWKKLEPKILKLWKAAQAGRWRFVNPADVPTVG